MEKYFYNREFLWLIVDEKTEMSQDERQFKQNAEETVERKVAIIKSPYHTAFELVEEKTRKRPEVLRGLQSFHKRHCG